MRIRPAILIFILAVQLLASSAVLAAQAESGQPSDVLKQLHDFDEDQLAVILIFGTGFVAALLWGLSAIVRAFRDDPASAAAVRADVAALEQRVAALEQALGAGATDGEAVKTH